MERVKTKLDINTTQEEDLCVSVNEFNYVFTPFEFKIISGFSDYNRKEYRIDKRIWI